MANILGKGNGIFSLAESDQKVGSFFTPEDLALIFETDLKNLELLPRTVLDNLEVVNESDAQKYWYQNLLPGVQSARIRNFSRSFDELVLAQLIRQVYPEASIEQQTKWGRKSIDLLIREPRLGTKIVEFHGPGHFAPGRYGNEIHDPFVRKSAIENDFKVECIIWPYWMQRCETNVKAIYDSEVRGLGALWSANTHFGDFIFDNSAEIIERISERFKASRGGFGYFYGPDTEGREIPQHPIINSISRGKTRKSKILPRGFREEASWLPSELIN